MCDRCVKVAASVEEAVAAEALPVICSHPTCEEAPVVRVSLNPDAVELLCVDHLVFIAVAAGVASVTANAVKSGRLSLDTQVSWTRRVADRFRDELELLS